MAFNRASLFLLAVAILPATALAADYYRYRDQNGVLVINDMLPPEQVALGYEIIDDKGRVKKLVPAQLSGEQLAIAQAEQARREQAAADKQAALERDQQLLLRFGSTAEIEQARDRTLAEIDSSILLLQTNLKTGQEQIAQQQSVLADLTREGQSLPEAEVAKMKNLRREVKYLESQITLRQQDRQREDENYAADIARYQILRPLEGQNGGE